MRITFTEELDALEATLQEEGDLVLRALRAALNALARGDDELADEVIRFDDEVDRRYLAIEEGIQSLLARQTPVAIDLRLVLAVLHVNLHLERMADYCVTIAKLTKLMGELDVRDERDRAVDRGHGPARRADDPRRARLVRDARRREGADARRARRADRPREPDASEDVLALGDSPEEREWGLRMLVVSRCLERIGDHAVDIGEQIAYLVTGEFREFTRRLAPRVARRAPSERPQGSSSIRQRAARRCHRAGPGRPALRSAGTRSRHPDFWARQKRLPAGEVLDAMEVAARDHRAVRRWATQPKEGLPG